MNMWKFLSIATVCFTVAHLVELVINPDREEQ